MSTQLQCLQGSSGCERLSTCRSACLCGGECLLVFDSGGFGSHTNVNEAQPQRQTKLNGALPFPTCGSELSRSGGAQLVSKLQRNINIALKFQISLSGTRKHHLLRQLVEK